MDPVKIFFLSQDKKLTSDANYYICLFINECIKN